MIGRETLNKLKVELNLKNSSIENDNFILAMKPLLAKKDPQYVMNIYQESLETETMKEEPNVSLAS